MGIGNSSKLHTSKILRLLEDLPFVIETVDNEARIGSFLPILDEMKSGGLIALE